MRQTSVWAPRPVGVTGQGVPVIGFEHAPGTAPVAVARVRERLPVLGADGTHTHEFLVLFYVLRGHGRLLIDGRTWTVTRGDLFVIAPGQVLSFHDPHDKVVTDGWAVWFPADVVRPGTSGAYSSWRTHPLLFPFARGTDRAQRLHVPPADRAEWTGRFTALDGELRSRRDGHREAALAHLTLLLVAAARLSTGVAAQFRSSGEPLLAAVFDTIERRYHEPLSLAGVAADLGLTPGHLTTVVRRRTGRTVQQWIAQRRMRQARLLLGETDLTVAAISRRVGYPDVSYFIKRFRADHGMTPARWRDATP
ncbi:helix-turn-helix domain-containing protein [Plantactinospora sp. GCM10030261]|uniref:helix-turn-helix transcriptional regulator n=1 Tax=Plantactinospora sp. GCM10030261 TaxID=3273420 RepID=UPI00360D3B94